MNNDEKTSNNPDGVHEDNKPSEYVESTHRKGIVSARVVKMEPFVSVWNDLDIDWGVD